MRYLSPVVLILAMFAFVFAGCAKPDASSTAEPGAEDGGHDHGDHAGQGEGGMSDMDKMKAELAKLSPEDAASAEAQHICPVTGEMLGTMGAPKKVDVNGQTVWICCNGCKNKLLKNPEEYLAKLKKE